MSILPLAFLLGALGSLHCAVMCGPLVLGLPTKQSNFLASAFQLVLYQLGRIAVYCCLGLLIGLVGNCVALLTSQETVSFIVGVVLIVFTAFHLLPKQFKISSRVEGLLIVPIGKMMGKVYQLPYWGFFAGALNGLIPCGMVYLALASALSTGSLASSISFMFLFGLGTTPLMLAISLGGIYLRRYFTFDTKKLVTYFMLALGLFFVFRSLEVDIPFLSPSLNLHVKGEAAECR